MLPACCPPGSGSEASLPCHSPSGVPEPMRPGPDSFTRLARPHLVWPCHPLLFPPAFFSVPKCHCSWRWPLLVARCSQDALPACLLPLTLCCQVSSETALLWPPTLVLVPIPSSKRPETPALPEHKPTLSLSPRNLESRRRNGAPTGTGSFIHSIHSSSNKYLLSIYYEPAEPGVPAPLGTRVLGT